MDTKYLISVIKNRKCVESVLSEDLSEIPTLTAKYSGADIELFNLASCMRMDGDEVMEVVGENKKIYGKRGKNPYRVQCVETGEIYESVAECSSMTGASVVNIYQSLHSGYKAKGYHYKYCMDDCREIENRNLVKLK